jgi:hypothetical protein
VDFLENEIELKESLGLDTDFAMKKSLGLDTDFAEDLKPLAEFSLAVAKLCFELYSRIPFLQEKYCQPILLWYFWEREQCGTAIQSSGLIPELYHQHPPKDQFSDEASLTAQWLSNICTLSKDQEVFPEGIQIDDGLDIMSLILICAAKAAQVIHDKGFRKAYSNFYKLLRSSARYVREHEEFVRHGIQNGEIVEGGRKIERRKKIVGQVFQPGVGYVISPNITKSLQETD